MKKGMQNAVKLFVMTVLFSALLPSAASASHPLITDDAETQGSGKFQLELNGEYANAGGNTDTRLDSIFSAGIRENIDIVLTLPYESLSEKDGAGGRSADNGFSDTTLEVKWRFHEKDGVSFALKPGVILSTGDEEKGLGDGKTGYSIFFIAQKEKGPLTVLLNLGYIRNRLDMRNIMHASVAAEYEATEKLAVVGNIGIETNPDRGSDSSPAFLIGGLIYSAGKNFDLDCGVKAGLTRAEADYSLLAGMAYRF